MPNTYKNIAAHPLDLDDGRVLAPNDTATLKSPGPTAQAHLDAGTLVQIPEQPKGGK